MFIARALEINNFQDDNVKDVIRFVVKNYVPAVVVKPESAVAYVYHRLTSSHKFKIILAVDFPNGSNFGMSKFNNLPDSIFSADGFDIKLSPNIDVNRSNAELAVIYKYLAVKSSFTEIRWALNLDVGSEASNNQKLMEVDRFPVAYIRHNSSFDVKVTAQQLSEQVAKLRSLTSKPIKMSGIHDYKVMTDMMKIHRGPVRFDVTYAQALKILNDERKEMELNSKMAANGTAI